MPYAIIRTAKLKTIGNIAGSAAHNFRERPTPNADPDRTHENTTSGARSAKEVVEGVKSRLATVPTIRKNAVLAVEYFIGASPEWFKQQNRKTIEAYFDRAEDWLKKKHGAENVIAFTRQYDETTPHVCAYVVPIDPEGKLNCSYFLDGREKMSQMQSDFAEKVGRQFGLSRGIEGSKAKHQTIKQYYAKIQAPTPELSPLPPEPKPSVLDKIAETIGIETAYSRAVQRREAAIKQRTAEFKKIRAIEQAKARQYEIEKAANKAREERLNELRATATQARNLPLQSVLERLGCTRDPKDKNNWKTPIGRLTVNDSKFFAHDFRKGGGGAIDLVMMVEQMDYKDAVGWLARQFGTGAVLAQAVATLKQQIEAAAKAPPRPYRAPEPETNNWPKVRKYLTEIRKLSEKLVDELHAKGKVYADKFRNAVFVLGKGEGVELRGTGETPFHGVRGEKKPFVLPGDKDCKEVAFVESAIDAISLRELGLFKGRILSMTGSSSKLLKEKAADYRGMGWKVFAAFDNDPAGDNMSASIGECERLRPNLKDWNEDLQQAKRSTTQPPKTPKKQQEQERQHHRRFWFHR